MKRLFILFAALILLSGCGNDQVRDQGDRVARQTEQTPPSAPPTVTPPSTPEPTPTPTPEPTEPPPTEPPQTKAPEPQEERIVRIQTKILDASGNRVNNIKLSAKAINGYLIEPGAEFSFNDVVGERSPENGYKIAPVIIEKKQEMDYGGGVCQVSSTLYQAACDAGLEIRERHAHGKPVNYIAAGYDAAVSYNGYNMRFVNNTDDTLKIKTTVGQYVTVSLYRMMK